MSLTISFTLFCKIHYAEIDSILEKFNNEIHPSLHISITNFHKVLEILITEGIIKHSINNNIFSLDFMGLMSLICEPLDIDQIGLLIIDRYCLFYYLNRSDQIVMHFAGMSVKDRRIILQNLKDCIKYKDVFNFLKEIEKMLIYGNLLHTNYSMVNIIEFLELVKKFSMEVFFSNLFSAEIFFAEKNFITILTIIIESNNNILFDFFLNVYFAKIGSPILGQYSNIKNTNILTILEIAFLKFDSLAFDSSTFNSLTFDSVIFDSSTFKDKFLGKDLFPIILYDIIKLDKIDIFNPFLNLKIKNGPVNFDQFSDENKVHLLPILVSVPNPYYLSKMISIGGYNLFESIKYSISNKIIIGTIVDYLIINICVVFDNYQKSLEIYENSKNEKITTRMPLLDEKNKKYDALQKTIYHFQIYFSIIFGKQHNYDINSLLLVCIPYTKFLKFNIHGFCVISLFKRLGLKIYKEDYLFNLVLALKNNRNICADDIIEMFKFLLADKSIPLEAKLEQMLYIKKIDSVNYSFLSLIRSIGDSQKDLFDCASNYIKNSFMSGNLQPEYISYLASRILNLGLYIEYYMLFNEFSHILGNDPSILFNITYLWIHYAKSRESGPEFTTFLIIERILDLEKIDHFQYLGRYEGQIMDCITMLENYFFNKEDIKYISITHRFYEIIAKLSLEDYKVSKTSVGYFSDDRDQYKEDIFIFMNTIFEEIIGNVEKTLKNKQKNKKKENKKVEKEILSICGNIIEGIIIELEEQNTAKEELAICNNILEEVITKVEEDHYSMERLAICDHILKDIIFNLENSAKELAVCNICEDALKEIVFKLEKNEVAAKELKALIEPYNTNLLSNKICDIMHLLNSLFSPLNAIFEKIGSSACDGLSLLSDLDLVCCIGSCIGSCIDECIDDKNILSICYNILCKNENVINLKNIDAMVPILKFELYGVQVDFMVLLYNAVEPINNIQYLLKADNYQMVNVNSKSQFYSIIDTRFFIGFISKFGNEYNDILKFVKIWAYQVGIYSSIFGYLNGATLAIMVAYIFEITPNSYTVFDIINSFFCYFSKEENWNVSFLMDYNRHTTVNRHTVVNRHIANIYTHTGANVANRITDATMNIIINKFRECKKELMNEDHKILDKFSTMIYTRLAIPFTISLSIINYENGDAWIESTKIKLYKFSASLQLLLNSGSNGGYFVTFIPFLEKYHQNRGMLAYLVIMYKDKGVIHQHECNSYIFEKIQSAIGVFNRPL